MTSTNNTPTVGKKSKTNEAALADDLSAGTQKHLSTMTQLIVGGGTYTPAQAETQLKAISTLRSDVDAARTTLKAKIAAEKTQIPALRTFLLAYVAYIRGTFGNSPDVLADFGLTPKKAATPLTAEQKAVAAAKRKATRAARGTTGKKAKLAVKGNVAGLVMTPVLTTTAASPAASATREPSQPVQPALVPSPALPSPAAVASAPKA